MSCSILMLHTHFWLHLRSFLWIVGTLHTGWHAIYGVSYEIRLVYNQFGNLRSVLWNECASHTHFGIYLISGLWNSLALHTLWHTMYAVSYGLLLLHTHFGAFLYTVSYGIQVLYTQNLARYLHSVLWTSGDVQTVTLHRVIVHHITLHCITLHYVTLHYITPQCITPQYTTLHYISRHYITLHDITYTTLHDTALYYITLQYTMLH